MKFVLATKNRNKIEEMKKICSLMGTATSILTLDDFPAFEDVVEDGDTFEANAVKKAKHIATCTGMTAISDDSGLVVDALDGAPGVYSARYAGENADDITNLNKLMAEMKDVPSDQRTARFVCCIAMVSGNEVKTFFGEVEGIIGMEPKGKNGFGYDPVFIPKGHKRTFAEMKDDEKNAISHRGRALGELQKYLLEKRGYIRGF